MYAADKSWQNNPFLFGFTDLQNHTTSKSGFISDVKCGSDARVSLSEGGGERRVPTYNFAKTYTILLQIENISVGRNSAHLGGGGG